MMMVGILRQGDGGPRVLSGAGMDTKGDSSGGSGSVPTVCR